MALLSLVTCLYRDLSVCVNVCMCTCVNTHMYLYAPACLLYMLDTGDGVIIQCFVGLLIVISPIQKYPSHDDSIFL